MALIEVFSSRWSILLSLKFVQWRTNTRLFQAVMERWFHPCKTAVSQCTHFPASAATAYPDCLCRIQKSGRKDPNLVTFIILVKMKQNKQCLWFFFYLLFCFIVLLVILLYKTVSYKIYQVRSSVMYTISTLLLVKLLITWNWWGDELNYYKSV